MFESIEKLKQDFTDKYVEVDDGVPELARFAGHVGQVKTVNMNGRALVQFDAWSNIGWYDIELDFLKVVPKPDPQAAGAKPAKPAAKPAAKAAPAAAAGGKKLSPLEMARMQGAAKRPGAEEAAPAGGAKKSTADILAAARAGKAAAGAADKPAAKPPADKKPAEKPAAGKMSTADILAAARANKAAAAEAAAEAPAAAEPAAPAEEAPAAEAPQPAAKAAAPVITKGERPSVADILAWCRAHDAK